MDILDAENIDAESDSGTHHDLTSLYNKLSALQCQNSLKWAQRARLVWVQCGDNNSSFFHNSVRFHNHQNNISLICDSNRICFYDQFGIEQVFCSFFTNLWTETSGRSFEEILYALPNNLPFISPYDGEVLVRDVTNNEVYLAFQSLP